VSEVIFGALASDLQPPFGGKTPLADALAELSMKYYPTNVLAAVPEIEGMDELIEFVAEIGGLKQAVPEFL
jgi:hypothetical protein